MCPVYRGVLISGCPDLARFYCSTYTHSYCKQLHFPLHLTHREELYTRTYMYIDELILVYYAGYIIIFTPCNGI